MADVHGAACRAWGWRVVAGRSLGSVVSGLVVLVALALFPGEGRTQDAERHFLLSLLGAPLSDAPFEQRVRPFEPIPDNTRTQSVRSTITVAERAENTTIQSLVVYVQIRHEFIGDLRVTLVPPEATGIEDVVLYNRSEDDEWSNAPDFFRVYSSQGDVGRAPMASDLEQGEWVLRADAGLASLVGNSAQGEWVLTVGDYAGKDVGRVEMWGLEINMGVRVIAGGGVAVEATLSGVDTQPLGVSQLFPGESLEVYWAYPQGMGVTLSRPTVVFSTESGIDNVTRDTMLNATQDATSGTLAPVLVGTLPANAVVYWSALPVEVAPAFRLAFTTPEDVSLETAQVLAGGATEVAVVLEDPGLLEIGEVVQVSLSPEGVMVSPSMLTLTRNESSRTVVISAAHDVLLPRGTVVASGGAFSSDGTVANMLAQVYQQKNKSLYLNGLRC